MSNLKDIADKTIRPALGKMELVKENYNTSDIIKTILAADANGKNDVNEFVKYIEFTDLNSLCSQLHSFVRQYIHYKEDPRGDQYVKTPAAVWSSKVADCKSFSLFIASCLKALNIPYSYRFVSFSSVATYTHVYVIAHGANRNFIIDGVLPAYNKEKRYTFKKDVYMNGLYKISGTSKGSLNLPNDIENLSDAQLEARIIRQRLQITHDIVSEMRGIGSTKAEGMRKSMRVLDAFIQHLDNNDFEGMQGIINQVPPGMGSFSLKNLFKKASDTVTHYVDQGKKVVTTAARAVTKVLTAPARLAAKGILEVSLPQAAPFFLYLFINDAAIIAKLPAKIRNKRNIEQKVADFIVDGIGMKRAHFMGIIRNGIMNHYRTSPEQVIANILKGKARVHGIGDGKNAGDANPVDSGASQAASAVPGASAMQPAADAGQAATNKGFTAILQKVFELIKKLFGKKDAPSMDNGAPTADDVAEVPGFDADGIAKDVLKQQGAQIPGLVPDDGGKKFFGIC